MAAVESPSHASESVAPWRRQFGDPLRARKRLACTRTQEGLVSMPPVTLTLRASQHQILLRHLFPDDRCEAVAILLCGRAESARRHRLLCRHVELIPYASCSVRLPDRVTWPTDVLVPLLAKAAANHWAIVKVHGH